MPIARSKELQVKVCIWVALTIFSLALIGLALGYILGDPALILSMYWLVVRFGAVAFAGIIAYFLITAILNLLIK